MLDSKRISRPIEDAFVRKEEEKLREKKNLLSRTNEDKVEKAIKNLRDFRELCVFTLTPEAMKIFGQFLDKLDKAVKDAR